MGLCTALADRIVATQYADFPASAVHWGKTSILDTIAVAFAGALEPAVSKVDAVIGRGALAGPALVIGTDRRLQPLEAAMINGMAAHVLDFDTSNDTFEGHPSVHLLPALLALGEQLEVSGEQLLHAYIVGFEAQARLSQATQPSLVGRGWFPTSTLGVCGAAAGAGVLLGFDRDRIAQAISMSVMFASGTLAHAGSMTKPLGSGHAARNGLLAALMVGEGVTAAPDAIGDRRGYLNLFSDAAQEDFERALGNWGAPFDIEETSIGIKRYPCCGIIHSSLDVLGDLQKREGFSAGDVEKLEVYLITQRLKHIDRPNPSSPIEGKFSVQYCLARLLLSGEVGLASFSQEAVDDPAARAVMARIGADVHPDVHPTARSQEGGTELVVTLTDGRRLVAGAPKALGRVRGEPLPDEMVDAKFVDCTAPVLSADRAARLLELLRHLESVESITEISEAMLPA